MFSIRHIMFCMALLVSIHGFCRQTFYRSYILADEVRPQKILALAQSKQGYILAGTNQGLYKFNGSTFQKIPFADTLTNIAITAIAQDDAGTIWVGLQSGMIGFVNKQIISLLRAEEGHPAVAITDILVDKSTNYFATAGEGIYYYRSKRFYNINADDGLSDNYVYGLAKTPTGLLAATDKGLNTINLLLGKKQITSFTSTEGLPDNIVRCVMPVDNLEANNKRQFLVGMQDKGLAFFHPQKRGIQLQVVGPSWKHGQVNALLNDGNKIWIATENDGLKSISQRYAGTNVPLESYQLPFSKISHLLKDDEGNIWFASNNALIKMNGAQLQNTIALTPKSFQQTNTLLVDKAGNIWMNTRSGLRKYFITGSTWQYKTFSLAGLSNNTEITCLYQDIYGTIWVGTLGNGIYVIDPVTARSRKIYEEPLLNRGSILSVSGRHDHIYISSLEGAMLCKLTGAKANIDQPYTFKSLNDINGIGNNYIYSIFEDSKGRVWFATDGKGLLAYYNHALKNFNAIGGIKNLVIYNICEDKQGNIWCSTLNNGLYKFDNESFVPFTIRDGLNDATVTSLQTDARGNIVALTKKGLNIIDPLRLSISYIDQNQGVDVVNTDLNSIAQSNDQLFISTGTGVVKYTPTYQSLLPKIVLEKVQLFLNDVDTVTTKTFSYDEDNLSFFFNGISFSHPDKLRYQYQLQGFSNQWITTKDNSINFPRLPPGKYVFTVRVSLSNGFAHAPFATYAFTISRPFYLRWWFILFSMVCMFGIVYSYIKSRELRVKRLDRLEKEKVQFQFETLKSQVNPHFLFNSFNTLIAVIEDDPATAVHYVEHLSDLYRKIVTYRNKDIISLAEEIELINDYFFIQQQRFGHNLQMHNNLTSQQMAMYSIAPLTLQLLCENAVKHNEVSADKPLTISIIIVNNMLVVSNNFNQKITRDKGAGMGLQNIRNRYRLLSNSPVKIEQTDQLFIVSIPLLLAMS